MERMAKFRIGASSGKPCCTCHEKSFICFQVAVISDRGETLHEVHYCLRCFGLVLDDIMKHIKDEATGKEWYSDGGHA